MGSHLEAATNPTVGGMLLLTALLISGSLAAPSDGHLETVPDVRHANRNIGALTALKPAWNLKEDKSETTPKKFSSMSTRESQGNDKEAESPILNSKMALEIVSYVLETGDEGSVVRFLERLIRERKISEEETIAFVETIQSYLDEAKMFSEIATMAEDKKDKEDKEVAEKKDRAADVLQKLMAPSSLEYEDTETILKINQLLEFGREKEKISNNLYQHLKEALIETTLEEAQQ